MNELNISDIISDSGVFTDGDWVESKDQNPKGSVRLIQLADIGDGYFKNKSQRFLTKEAALRLKCTFLKKGDILIARMPDPIGRACIFPDIGQDAVTVVDVCVVRPQKKNVFTPFVKYLINSPTFRYKISKHVTGTTRKRISRRNLNKIGFVLPPLIDQKRITKVLSDCENLIQWRKESIQLLDDYLESTFLEMFGDPISNKKGWKICTIEQLAKKEKYSLKRGPFGGALKKEIFVQNGYLVYEQYHALNNDFSFERYFIDENKYKELIAFAVNPGDIIISCSGVNLGRLAVIPEGAKEGIINQALLKVTLDQTKMQNDFFLYLFRHPNFKKKFFGSSIGSGVPNFPKMSRFKSFKFITPDTEIQNIFSKKVKRAEEIKENLQISLDEIKHLYNSISQRAFKGELKLDKVNIEKSDAIVVENKEILHGRTDFTNDEKITKRIDYANKNISSKKDISNLTLLDFLEIPFELYKDKIADDYGPELDFIDDDLFYQFYLKDNFKDEPFTFSVLQSKFNSYYIPKGKDFDAVKWKSIIFKYLESKEPLLEQLFEDESGTIKLKLTDEAFKA